MDSKNSGYRLHPKNDVPDLIRTRCYRLEPGRRRRLARPSAVLGEPIRVALSLSFGLGRSTCQGSFWMRSAWKNGLGRQGVPDALGGVRVKQVAGARSECRGGVAWVVHPAPLQRQAPAADAACELVPQSFQVLYAFVQPTAPAPRQQGPICTIRRPVLRQHRQCLANLVERKADTLTSLDKGHPTEGAAYKPATASGIALSIDQTLGLVEAKGRRRQPAPLRQPPNRQQVGLRGQFSKIMLDFKCT